MTWETFIMPAIVLGLAVIGGLGGYYTLRATNGEHTRRIVALEERASKDERDLAIHKDYVKDNFVRTSALNDMERNLSRLFKAMIEPITQQMKDANHKLNNIDTKIDSRISTILQGRSRGAN